MDFEPDRRGRPRPPSWPATILDEHCTPERLKAVEAGDGPLRPRPVAPLRRLRAARPHRARGARRQRARPARALPACSSRSGARSRRSRSACTPSPRWPSRAFGNADAAGALAAGRRARRVRPHHRPVRGPAVRPRREPVDPRRERRRPLAAHREQGGGAGRHRWPTCSSYPPTTSARPDRLPRPPDDPGRHRRARSSSADGEVVGPARARPRRRPDGPRARRRSARAPRSCEWLAAAARPSPCARSSSASLEGALALTADVRQDARAVRPADRHLPGRLAAAGRRLHRRAGRAADHVAGGLAAQRGAARRRRSRDRQAVGRRRRSPDRAHDGARARRCRHRPRRRGAPLLHRRQAPRVHPGRHDRPGPRDRRAARRTSPPDRDDHPGRAAGARRRRPPCAAGRGRALDLAGVRRRSPPAARTSWPACSTPDRPPHVGAADGQHPGDGLPARGRRARRPRRRRAEHHPSRGGAARRHRARPTARSCVADAAPAAAARGPRPRRRAGGAQRRPGLDALRSARARRRRRTPRRSRTRCSC